MNRAMFSGVAGMKTHQAKMDVIGNNIANVNTYAYKSQRAIFSDVYYQTLRSASAGTTSRGGTNPSSVGYGSSLAAIQTQMSQSSMQNTGFGMDVAIVGEGFLQVMDPNGNIFYTKAGMLDYDANGYLTDINGNFVLGATGANGKAGSQKIKLDNIGSVDAKKPTAVETINGVEYTVTASNADKFGNVSIAIGSSESLPAGLKASASISNTGAITVQLNAFEKFNSMTEVNTAINAAITEANEGEAHPAGQFTITASENKFGTDASAGTWTGAATAEDVQLTPVDVNGLFGGALSITAMDLQALPTGVATENMNITKNVHAGPPLTTDYTIDMTVEGISYKGTFEGNIAADGTIKLEDDTTPSAKSITLKVTDKDLLNGVLAPMVDAQIVNTAVEQTPPQYFLGGSTITSVSSNFSGQGAISFTCTPNAPDYEIKAEVGGKTYIGTVPIDSGGTVTLKTGGDEKVDGTMTMQVPSKDKMFENYGIDPNPPAAADTALAAALTASLSQHNYVAIPATAGKTTPLTGAEIADVSFGYNPGSIEGMEDGVFGGSMVLMKTSSNFMGDGTVDTNDFKASYTDNGTDPAFWTVSMTIDGAIYEAEINEETKASSLLLKGPEGDYIQVSNPGMDAMNDYFRTLNPNTDPANGDPMPALKGNAELTVTPAVPSKNLGLSASTFALTGGTEGGTVTLDQLSSIAIGPDGTISVSHAEKGTVVAGRISLANFANPSGLQMEGTNYYAASANSGDPRLCDPGSEGSGSLKSSALEMSNVDLSAEFAEMITTQRGFQANSRVITVSDTMLEELINLKR